MADALGVWAQVYLVALVFGCGACDDRVIGGPRSKHSTTGVDTVSGVEQTIQVSRFDVLFTPTEMEFVDESGDVHGYVQDECPLDPVGHLGLVSDSGVAQMVANALVPARAAPVQRAVGLADLRENRG